MKIRTLVLTSIAATMAFTNLTKAGGPDLGGGVVLFEDALAFFGPGSVDVEASGFGDFYADQGMTISSNEQLWIGNGVSNGDFGNFDIEGTNGPGFISLFDTDDGGTITFSFDGPVDFLIDLIVTSAGGTEDVVCTVTTLKDGKIIFHEIITLTTPIGDPDGVSFFRTYLDADTFHFQLAPTSNRVLAFDYIEWGNLSCGPADINKDGRLNFGDISAFLNEYGAGCNE